LNPFSISQKKAGHIVNIGSMWAKQSIAATLQGFNGFHPIGRIGTPEEVANVVAFLLPKPSSWVTGDVWDKDGGVMAGRN
jgi:NAD(P)-dependent dehydrogenase (short-subunit alcohol dehydrogenase family)